MIQDKNQITLSDPGESNQWADFSANRRVCRIPDTTEALRIPDMTKSAAAPTNMRMSHFNEMPPGYSATNQCGNVDNFRELSLAGATDATNHVTADTLMNGYFSAPLSAEQFSNDREALFDDGVGGFVPRNNYLDR